MPEDSSFLSMIPLLAADASIDLIAAGTASLMVAAAVFVMIMTVLNTLHSADLEQDEGWRYDINRINELRRVDFLYRALQPVLQAFARINRVAFREYLPEIGRETQAAGLPRFWTPEEYLSKLEVIALLLAPSYVYGFVALMCPAG